MSLATLARWEGRLRPWLSRLPPSLAVRLYSAGRRRFLSALSASPPSREFRPSGFERELWGLRFGSPIMNAGGMFKNGEGYRLAAAQGAGAYLAGTTTARPRRGNRRLGINQPFAPYPVSAAASNWLGLPNPGHSVVAARLRGVARTAGCPLGASLAAVSAPELEQELESLASGMRLYEEAGVDFLEINESCPNTEDEEEAAGFEALGLRLGYLKEAFLDRRQRRLPVIVKVSCDTRQSQVPELMEHLCELGFDGVNFGNTSVDYAAHRRHIAAAETGLYDFFTRAFGGGVSGRPLKEVSLALSAAAMDWLCRHPQERELHVLRTGGVEDAEDLRASEAIGVSLNQWYSGYFDAFSRHGHRLYDQLYRRLAESAAPASLGA